MKQNWEFCFMGCHTLDSSPLLRRRGWYPRCVSLMSNLTESLVHANKKQNSQKCFRINRQRTRQRPSKSGVFTATLLAACLAWSTQAYAQDSYTSADLLERPIEAQNAHIQVSVMMIGVVATQIRPDIAHCVDDWYGSQTDARNEHIRSLMREHSEFHPAGVILAVVQRECGRFADEP